MPAMHRGYRGGPQIFCYGTLLDGVLRKRVAGGLVQAGPARPGVLRGYRRIRLPGRSYPGLVPARAATLRGRVVRLGGVDALRRIRWYEGAEYRLVPVPLNAGGRRLTAGVFLVAADAGPRTAKLRRTGPRLPGPGGKAWSRARWHRQARRAALAALGRSLVRSGGPLPPTV